MRGRVRQGIAVVCFTPAKPVPSTLWGELQAVDGAQLPAERDTTNFNEFREQYSSRNWFYGVDIQNGWILAGLAHGIGIWDGRTNPGSPTFVAAKRYGPGPTFPTFRPARRPRSSSAASPPPREWTRWRPSRATTARACGLRPAGQDDAAAGLPEPAKTSESVYSTTIGSTHYAFMASNSPERCSSTTSIRR